MGPAPETQAPALAAPAPWIDSASVAAAQAPLTLYDVRWLILTGESGAYASVPPTLHNFTLGRWECALGAERAQDELSDSVASVQRKRRLVCTHPTGVVAQTELSCGFRMPSALADGSPKQSRREAQLTLSDAPSVSISCEPEIKERLTLYRAEREKVAEACVAEGKVTTCPPAH